MSPDHPRSRGVYTRCCWSRDNVSGSSPLARGLPYNNGLTVLEIRIIPARAGFTAMTQRTRTQWEDHPRSRGVYGSMSHPRERAVGSSPLARGLRCATRGEEDSSWIIPARAGFTY